ncbi:MAG: MgtC/SapB family protein [Planctomycetales bacterium]|nr:MgtC/SapB family protein [Planctomycetales bacterium]
MTQDFFQSIALSLGLGLLVGLQREWKESDVAGIRTFPLITLLGTIAYQLDASGSPWIVATGLLAVATLLTIANFMKANVGRADPGITTEAAALLMYLIGAAIGAGYTAPAVVTTGIAAVLLHWKQPLHGMVGRIGKNDFKSLIYLVLIALVILPVLPDETYGPYNVLNPYRIWLMVVLIVGISLAAYVAYKLLGAGAGAILGGILGGFISSTATTVSYARQTKGNHDANGMAALVIVIASTIVNARVLFEIGVVAPKLLRVALAPIGLVLLLMAMESLVLYLLLRRQTTQLPDHDNPAQLKPAIVFGALYAVILLLVAAAKHHFGNQALFGIAIISGLTDVDAITLSSAKLFQDGRLESTTAWRVILLATMSNLVFKAGTVVLLGNRKLSLYILTLFAIALLGAGVLWFYWPHYELIIPAELLPSAG